MYETLSGNKNAGVLSTLVDCRKRKINTAKPISSSWNHIQKKSGPMLQNLRCPVGRTGIQFFRRFDRF